MARKSSISLLEEILEELRKRPEIELVDLKEAPGTEELVALLKKNNEVLKIIVENVVVLRSHYTAHNDVSENALKDCLAELKQNNKTQKLILLEVSKSNIPKPSFWRRWL